MQYKVRMIEHIWQQNYDKDGKYVSKSLYDTVVYNLIVKAKSKRIAKKVYKHNLPISRKDYKDTKKYRIVVSVGRVYDTLSTDYGKVTIPVEKEVDRDVNWRETIKEMV